MYRIVRIISPWAIFLKSALNRVGLYYILSLYTNIPHISDLYLYKNFELKRGRAYNTSWAYNTYYTRTKYPRHSASVL